MLRSTGGPFAALVVLALTGLVACGDDDSSVVGEETGDVDAYCVAITEYDEVTSNFDASSISAVRESMEQAAAALRTAADVAPPEVSDDVSALFTGAEAVADLAATTEGDDLQAWLDEMSRATADLESQTGDLEAETTAVQDHAASVCGLEIG